MKGVKEVYGLHNASVFDEGQIRTAVGTIMAGCSGVTITVKGKGGHGSFP
jgi:metal-dependent amidase/aminoacylase/carboxypeptidase family protein